jgi:hypothetical protein
MTIDGRIPQLSAMRVPTKNFGISRVLGRIPDDPSEIRTLAKCWSVRRQVGEAGKAPSSAALGFATEEEAFIPRTNAATVAAISHR